MGRVPLGFCAARRLIDGDSETVGSFSDLCVVVGSIRSSWAHAISYKAAPAMDIITRRVCFGLLWSA